LPGPVHSALASIFTIARFCLFNTGDPEAQAVKAGLRLFLDSIPEADSAYAGEPIAKALEEKGVENKIHERAYRNKPLTDEQKERNREKSKVRARIEHVFGFIEKNLGGSFIRSTGKSRSAGIIGWRCQGEDSRSQQ
jgi:hypothetical protein